MKNEKNSFMIFSQKVLHDSVTFDFEGMYATYNDAKNAVTKLICERNDPELNFYIYDARLKLESVTKFDDEDED